MNYICIYIKVGLGFQVVDRPMTHQGLGGIKGSNQG